MNFSPRTFARRKSIVITIPFHKTHIFELKSQNCNINSLVCEIFTNLAVKIQKDGIQRVFCMILHIPQKKIAQPII